LAKLRPFSFTFTDSLDYCLAQLQRGIEPGLGKALLALRTQHIKKTGGIAHFRIHGGLAPLLGILSGSPRPRRTLDLALSILGNCCTEEGTRTQVRELGGIPPLVIILKSLAVESILNRTARALGNLAIDSENCQAIHEAGAVPQLIQVLTRSQDSECLQSVIRAIRYLADTPAHRLVLTQQGAVRPIVERLASSLEDGPLIAAAVRTLLELSKGCSHDCAEQLSLGGGIAPLVALASHEKQVVQESAVAVLANLCLQGMLRPAIGNAGGVELLVGEIQRRRGTGAPGPSLHPLVKALCLLCCEAVNRSRVRETGGLELLLSLLRDRCHSYLHARVVVAFVAFFYDEKALEMLQAGGLVPLLVGRLAAQSQWAGRKQVEEEEEREYEKDAASFDFPAEGRRGEQALTGAESSSFQSLRSWLVSEGYISSPGDLSPQWSPDGVFPLPEVSSPWLSLALPLSFSPHVGDPDLHAPEAPALLLLSRFSQAEDPSRSLVTPDTLQGLLRYVTGSPSPSSRCLRLLHRLTCNPACLEAFVRSHGPSLIRSWLILGDILIYPDCWLLFSPVREALLMNLCVQAESPFGVGLLTHMLLSGCESDQASAALALPLICRKDLVCRKLLVGLSGLRILLGVLARDHDPHLIFYTSDVLSRLLSSPAPSPPSFSPPALKRPRLDSSQPCRYSHMVAEGGVDLFFQLDSGRRVPAVRQVISDASEVFRAMLSGGFAESSHTTVMLHDVSPEPFLALTHFLHGCRGRACQVLGTPFPLALAEEILVVAEQYLLPDLQALVDEALCQDSLCPGTLGEVYRLAERQNRPRLLRDCVASIFIREGSTSSHRAAALAELLRSAADPSGLAAKLLAVVLESPWGSGSEGQLS
uniref:Armadillo repeat containing 5 n=1 Tax=Pseudonaja textilis TaxID=8673 RepID=A0A670YVF0_PSETE